MNLDRSAILQIKSISAAQNQKPCLRIVLSNNAVNFQFDNCNDMHYGGCFAYTTNGVTVSAPADCEKLINGRTLYYIETRGFQLL